MAKRPLKTVQSLPESAANKRKTPSGINTIPVAKIVGTKQKILVIRVSLTQCKALTCCLSGKNWLPC